jgi:TP901 family phage tail tape measure protein
MAGEVHREKIQLDIEVGGNQARKQLNDLKEESYELNKTQKALRAEKAKLIKEDENYRSEVNRLNKALRENRFAIEQNESKQVELRKELGITSLTTRELAAEFRHLKQVQSNLVPGTAQWDAYQKKIEAVHQRMTMLRDGSTKLGMAIKDMATTVNHYAGIFMAIGFAIYGAYNLFVKGNKELADQLADTQRYTNLTRVELMALYGQLMKLNTRTSREELLGLANVAGKLGIEGRQNILQFVSAADKIKVALGEDLSDNVEDGINAVGKLVNIFKLDQKYGLEEAMLKVGSAINSVGQASSAQESYLVDFTKRVAGVAPIANISIDKIIGLAATLDILGQSAEVSSTVYAQVIPNMFKDTEVYAGIAGMKVSEFSKLLKTDANAAFLKLLEGLNGNNDGMEQMADRLTDLGLEGKRAVTVMGVLARAIDLIKQQQAYANQEFNRGTSISIEAALKLNNLAGYMDIIGKKLKNLFTGGAIYNGLTAITGKIVEWMRIPMSEQLSKEQASLNSLVHAITNANNTQDTRNSLIKELQTSYPNFLGNLSAEKVTNEELASRLADVNREYENKILLAIRDESLEKNYKQRVQLKQDELDLIKQLSDAERIAVEARKKITSGMDPNSYRNVLTQSEFNALRNLPILNKALEDNRAKVAALVQEETALNEAIRSLGASSGSPLGSAFTGKDKTGDTPDPANDPAVKETIDIEELRIAALEKGQAAELALENKRHNEQLKKFKFNAKALEYENVIHAKNMNDINKKFLDQQLADDTISYQLRMGQLQDSFEKGEITEEQYNDRKRRITEKWNDDILKYRRSFVSLSSEQLMNEEILAAQKRGEELGLKEEEIQAAIQTIRDKYAKKEVENAANVLEFKKSFLSVSNEELMNSEIDQARLRGEELKLTEEEIQQAIASIRKKYAKKGTKEMAANMQEEINLIVQGMDAQQQTWMRKAQGIMSVTEQMGEAMGGMFADMLSGQEDFANSFLTMALDMIQKYINLLLAKMLAESMAQADSVATFGATGAARFAVLSTIVNAAFGLAKGAIRNSGKTKQKRIGGYADVIGADDNRRYRAQVLGSASTGFLPSHPVLMPSGILASEAGREYYVDSPSLGSLVRDQLGLTVADHVRMIEAIKYSVPQRVVGGYYPVMDGKSNQSINPSSPQSLSLSPADVRSLISAITRLNDHLDAGIRANINKYGTNGIEEALKDIADFNAKVFKS